MPRAVRHKTSLAVVTAPDLLCCNSSIDESEEGGDPLTFHIPEVVYSSEMTTKLLRRCVPSAFHGCSCERKTRHHPKSFSKGTLRKEKRAHRAHPSRPGSPGGTLEPAVGHLFCCLNFKDLPLERRICHIVCFSFQCHGRFFRHLRVPRTTIFPLATRAQPLWVTLNSKEAQLSAGLCLPLGG